MDHLKPMILLSINTGMRRGEVFKLTWQSVNFDTRQLTVTGQTAKSGKTRYIPLNKEALDILKKWKLQRSSNSKLVFSNKDGTQFTTLKKGWAGILKVAGVQDFRWHDLRHHFASRLVMAGVNLNTVRELLGHSSYAMTLRYAHLSEGHKAEAVELLV
jgi:integrase